MQKPALTFVAVIVAAVIVTGYLLLQLRAVRSEAAPLREQVAQLEKALAATGSPLPAPRLAGQAPAVVAAPLGDGPAPSLPAEAAPPAPRSLALFSPEIRKALGLTAEEGEQFTQLLRDNRSRADFEALIGRDRYEQYEELQRTAKREVQLDGLRTSLASTRHPLTTAQSAQLDSLLEVEQRRRVADDSVRVRPTDPRARLAYDEATLKATQAANERVLDGAHSFLSAEQLLVVQNQLGSTVSAQLDSLQTRRATLDAGGR